MLGLLDPVIALDFDNCAAMRLLEWEAEVERAKWGAVEPELRFESLPMR